MGWKKWFGKKPIAEEGEQEFNVAIELVSIGETLQLADLFIEIPAPDILRALDGWSWLPLSASRRLPCRPSERSFSVTTLAQSTKLTLSKVSSQRLQSPLLN